MTPVDSLRNRVEIATKIFELSKTLKDAVPSNKSSYDIGQLIRVSIRVLDDELRSLKVYERELISHIKT
jgi:hypothetical protein